jgi:hypothetical protein
MEAAPGDDLPYRVTTKVILYQNLPCLDLEVTLFDKPCDPWPEAGWICLPLKIEHPQFRLQRLAAVMDPARDVVPGANRHFFALNGGMMVTDPSGHGIGLCSLDAPSVSLETPGCWKYSMDFIPRKASVFINLFNNQWTTNFRLWNGGTWIYRVRLWAVEHADNATELFQPSTEARSPLIAALADGPSGSLPLSQTGLEVSRPGVLVTAFGPNPLGKGLVLRLWEQAGLAGPCEVRLPMGIEINTVQPIDLRGRPSGQPIRVKNSAFRTPLRAFAPVTFLITQHD